MTGCKHRLYGLNDTMIYNCDMLQNSNFMGLQNCLYM